MYCDRSKFLCLFVCVLAAVLLTVNYTSHLLNTYTLGLFNFNASTLQRFNASTNHTAYPPLKTLTPIKPLTASPIH